MSNKKDLIHRYVQGARCWCYFEQICIKFSANLAYKKIKKYSETAPFNGAI